MINLLGKCFLALSYLLFFSFIINLSSCKEISDLLDEGSGDPDRESSVDEEEQEVSGLSSGNYLYCITNVGQTITPLNLSSLQIESGSQKILGYGDVVGPWFNNNQGYFISRVGGGGSGKNALFRFDPKSLDETGSINFPNNSNPSTMLILPNKSIAWITLKGSTFDNWASNGIAVVNLDTMAEVSTGYFDLNDFGDPKYTSFDQIVYDENRDLVYVVASNFNGTYRNGRIFVFSIDSSSAPTLEDQIETANNPFGSIIIHNTNELWIPHNQGFGTSDGKPGIVQIWDTDSFADGDSAHTLIDEIELSGEDPAGLALFSEDTAWLQIYPYSKVETIDLDSRSLNPSNSSLPGISDQLISTSSFGVFGTIGGNGRAELVKLNSSSGEVDQTIDLSAGNGPLQCEEYEVTN